MTHKHNPHAKSLRSDLALFDKAFPIPYMLMMATVVLLARHKIATLFFCLLFMVLNILYNVVLAHLGLSHKRLLHYSRLPVLMLLNSLIVFFAGSQSPGWLIAIPSLMAFPIVLPFYRALVASTLYNLSIIASYVYLGDDLATIAGIAMILFSFMIIFSFVVSELSAHRQELSNLNMELKEALMVKSNFLAKISHELRTPLNAILGLSDCLLSEKMDQERMQRDIGTIYNSGQLLLHELNDILEFSKLEAKKISIHREKIDIVKIIENSLQLFQANVQEKGLLLTSNLPRKRPPLLWGDGIRIGQIISNLLSNAVKYSDAGMVTIFLRTKIVANECIVKIAIKDEGHGIPMAKQHEIFHPFYQIDSTYSRRQSGTGLGLPISQNLVAIMGGVMRCLSFENKGSIFLFRLRLPLYQPQVEMAKQDDASLVDLAKLAKQNYGHLRTLIVEDNAVNQMVLNKILQTVGIQAEIAVNGAEAVSCLAQFDYNLVFMDLHMPIMDGFSAIAEIKQRKLLRNGNVVIALTADAFDQTRRLCLEAGFHDFITKPITKTIIHHKISQWFG